MSTARALAHALPGDALQRLNTAHVKVVAARLRYGLAVGRHDRELEHAITFGLFAASPESLEELTTAAAVRESAEEELRAAFHSYGLASGAIEDAGTARL